MITMVPEDGVKPPTTGRQMAKEVAALVKKFAAFKPGQSFFVPNVALKDVEYLRRPFKREGLGAVFRRVERDEIYQQPGVRVWRQLGEYDEI